MVSGAGGSKVHLQAACGRAGHGDGSPPAPGTTQWQDVGPQHSEGNTNIEDPLAQAAGGWAGHGGGLAGGAGHHVGVVAAHEALPRRRLLLLQHLVQLPLLACVEYDCKSLHRSERFVHIEKVVRFCGCLLLLQHLLVQLPLLACTRKCKCQITYQCTDFPD